MRRRLRRSGLKGPVAALGGTLGFSKPRVSNGQSRPCRHQRSSACGQALHHQCAAAAQCLHQHSTEALPHSLTLHEAAQELGGRPRPHLAAGDGGARGHKRPRSHHRPALHLQQRRRRRQRGRASATTCASIAAGRRGRRQLLQAAAHLPSAVKKTELQHNAQHPPWTHP